MTHDSLCPNQDTEIAECAICMLLRMARRDEQDKYSGDEEWDRQVVSEEAYAKGYAEGMKNIASVPAIKSSGRPPLEAINQYIVSGVGTRTLHQTQTLYDLYMYLGGK